MLFAVEGGGFFSSSASGYSKGLALLLLGQKNEENPMRVTPWTQYQLVDQETDPDIQLASGKNLLVRGCASFACFGHTAAGRECPSPPKVGPNQQQQGSPGVAYPDRDETQICSANHGGNENNVRKIDVKSSLRKPKGSIPSSVGNSHEYEALCRKGTDTGVQIEKRKVQWTDTSGGELFEIREFEPSDDGGSDDEFNSVSERTCSCVIM